MTIEVWDRQSLGDQETIIGRTKAEGAPLSGGTEHTQPDFAARRTRRPADRRELTRGARAPRPQRWDPHAPRRGYNFVDGSTALGRLDAGLFFIAYLNDPRTHFVPMQTRLAKDDLLSEYLRHTGSGLFAIPPGVPRGGSVGQPLFT